MLKYRPLPPSFAGGYMCLSGVFFSRTLKLAGTALILSALLVLPGCWVTSINPLYDEGSIDNPHNDPDMVFDQSLIGSWTATNDNCTTLLTIAAKNQIYDLQSTEQGEGCSEEKSHVQASLVKLDSHYFLDLSPVDDDVCAMCLARHEVFLAKFDKTTFSLTPIDSDWLKKSLEAKTVTLATVAGDTDTITASSRDLKAFCREFAGNTEAFKPESTETLKRR
jgi:hypothetical protein